MNPIYIHIESGEVKNPASIRKAARNMKDGWYKWEPKKSNKRSTQQNRYWWGVVVPMVKDGLRAMGYDDVKTDEDSHEVLKALFLKKKISNGLEEIEITGSTTDLSKTDFMCLIDDVAKWCSEYLGFVLLMPNEHAQMFETN